MADKMSRVECVEERAIMVDFPSIPNGIDDEKIRDRLTIYFQRKSNCGGDVAKVLYPIPSNSKKAIIVFNCIDLNSLLKKHLHVIHWMEDNSMHVKISRLPQMFDTIKVEVNPFYLNLVPRDKTDDLSLQLKKNANAVLVNPTSMEGSSTINFPDICYLESVRNVLANVVGLQNKDTISSAGAIEGVEDDTSSKQPSSLIKSQLEKTSMCISNRRDCVPTFVGESGNRVNTHQNTNEHMVRDHARRLAPSFSNDPNKDIDKNNHTFDNTKSGGRNSVISAGHFLTHQKFQKSEPLSVHMLLLHYLKVKHKQELDDICEKGKVTINCLSEANHEGQAKVYFTSTGESTFEMMHQAREQFADLYQSIYQRVTLRPLLYNDINNQSINQSTIDEAKRVISSKTPNVLVEDSVDGKVNFVGVEKNVEEAIKIFQTHTGLQHKPRKLRSHVDNCQSKGLSGPINTGRKDCDTGYPQDGACARPLHWQPVTSNFGKQVLLTDEGLEVTVQKGDITNQQVDVIVNASNTELCHGSGVAGALANVAGLELQQECDRIRRDRSTPLLDGECVYTRGYRLSCKHVIHAVGPKYNSYAFEANRFFSKLNETYLNCLKQANALQAKTIAIPLISSGIYGGPKELCAKALVGAIKQYSRENKSKTIKQIALVNTDNQANGAILKSMNWLNMDDDNTMEIEDCSSNAVQQDGGNTISFDSSGATNHIRDKQPYDEFGTEVFSNINVQIVLKQGELLSQSNTVNALIVPTDNMLRHYKWIARDIVSQAELQVHDACQKIMTKNNNVPLGTGNIEHTLGYNVGCGHLIFVVFPVMKECSGRKQLFEELRNIVCNCMKYADKILKASSVALPLITSDLNLTELYASAFAAALHQFTDTVPHTMKTILVVSNNVGSCFALKVAFENEFKGVCSTNSLGDTREGYDHQSKTLTNQRNLDILPDTANDNGSSEGNEKDKTCPICLDDFSEVKPALDIGRCKHKFCKECLDNILKHKPMCPICGHIYGEVKGNQPDGKMTVFESASCSIPGYEGSGCITIRYSFPSGIQGPSHPNPSRSYLGTNRTAYLPNNLEGKRILGLLEKAFDAKLTFTIGTSVTTGNTGAITWNDIHHKTSLSGGPTNFGYPDPTYLQRVTEELAAKGIK